MKKEILILLKNNYRYIGIVISEDDKTILLDDKRSGKIRITKSEIMVRGEE